MSWQIEESEPPSHGELQHHVKSPGVTYIWDWDKVTQAYQAAIRRIVQEGHAPFRSLEETRDQ